VKYILLLILLVSVNAPATNWGDVLRKAQIHGEEAHAESRKEAIVDDRQRKQEQEQEQELYRS